MGCFDEPLSGRSLMHPCALVTWWTPSTHMDGCMDGLPLLRRRPRAVGEVGDWPLSATTSTGDTRPTPSAPECKPVALKQAQQQSQQRTAQHTSRRSIAQHSAPELRHRCRPRQRHRSRQLVGPQAQLLQRCQGAPIAWQRAGQAVGVEGQVAQPGQAGPGGGQGAGQAVKVQVTAGGGAGAAWGKGGGGSRQVMAAQHSTAWKSARWCLPVFRSWELKGSHKRFFCCLHPAPHARRCTWPT